MGGVLNPDVVESPEAALECCVEALTMLIYGVSCPYGAPLELADGCSEQEALDACRSALKTARVSLEHARYGRSF